MSALETPTRARHEVIFASAYFAVYLGYLFAYQESEIQHWASLVLLPLAGLWLVGGRPRLRALIGSLGLVRGRIFRGLKWPIILGLAIQGVQLLNRHNRAALAETLTSEWGWIAPIVALPLLMITVGPTEEIFFRGILQRRVSDALASDWKGIVIATLAFILYHVPYAYLDPNWPSEGDLGHAFQLAAINGAMGGLMLGWVYVKSGGNLMSVILLHAMVDWIPGTMMVSQVKFGGG